MKEMFTIIKKRFQGRSYTGARGVNWHPNVLRKKKIYGKFLTKNKNNIHISWCVCGAQKACGSVGWAVLSLLRVSTGSRVRVLGTAVLLFNFGQFFFLIPKLSALISPNPCVLRLFLFPPIVCRAAQEPSPHTRTSLTLSATHPPSPSVHCRRPGAGPPLPPAWRLPQPAEPPLLQPSSLQIKTLIG